MSSYSEGQTHQLMEALQAKGFTPEQVTRLGQYHRLDDFRKVLDGLAEIVLKNHIINLDAKPFVPNVWKVEEHRKGGQPACPVGRFAWDPTKVGLFLADQQKPGVIVGHVLRKVLKNLPVLNANVLDYLLANPELIPHEWKGKYVFFWGTIYRDSDGNLYVRYLYWQGGRWCWDCDGLDCDWDRCNPAAVLAS